MCQLKNFSSTQQENINQ